MEFLNWLRSSMRQATPALAAKLPWAGVLLLVVSAGFGLRSWAFGRSRVRATATITENVAVLNQRGEVVYTPRFRLRLPDGDLLTLDAVNHRSQEIEFPAGESIPVLYPPGDPEGAILATVWLTYQGAIVFAVLGTLLFDLGWVLRLRLRRAETSRAGAKRGSDR